MKKILVFSLSIAALLSVTAADATFRVDFNSSKDKIALTGEENDLMKATSMGWVKDAEARKYTLTSWSKKKVSGTEWKDYKISFVPAASGTVEFSVGGQWAKTPQERQWILVNKMELNDKPYPNGDFKKTWTGKDGRVIPAGFWIAKGAKYLPAGGEKGTPAILVNHDNRFGGKLKVEAGKKYELEFEIKSASPADLK